MNSRLPGKNHIFFLLVVLSVAPLFWPGEFSIAAEIPKVQIKNHLKRGVEKVFQMDEKGGAAELMRAVELNKESPAGYAYLALAHLFFFEMSFGEREREENQEFMLRFVDQAFAKGEKWIEKDPKDGEAFLAIALAKLAKIRWLIGQKRYFAMAQEARNVWNYLEIAKELNPENFDIYFPMGLLHFHLDHLPGLTRFLSSLLITSGDRQKGLQELEWAATKGEMLKELAQAELCSAYSNFEKQPARALPLARDLIAKYPRNYNLLFSLANILSDLGHTDEASFVAREIETGIKSGIPPFRSELWPRYFQLIGKIHFDLGEYAKASEYLNRTILDVSPPNARTRALAFVRLGMIHDVRKERKRAEEYYQKALEVEGGEGLAQVAAKEYLKNPYTPANRK